MHLDNSIGVSPEQVAAGLRSQGFNAQSVNDIFKRDPGDPNILSLARNIGGRVVAADKGGGVEAGQGFGTSLIRVRQSLLTPDSIIKIVKEQVHK